MDVGPERIVELPKSCYGMPFATFKAILPRRVSAEIPPRLREAGDSMGPVQIIRLWAVAV
jgi:hypothetical protein